MPHKQQEQQQHKQMQQQVATLQERAGACSLELYVAGIHGPNKGARCERVLRQVRLDV